MLCGLMLLMSLSPLLSSVSAADEDGPTFVDTGWVQIDVPENGTGDFHHLIPYGVQMRNISFEVRVDGQNGLSLMHPEIYAPEAGSSILDWSAGGGLGRLLDFTGTDPHNGRMAPRSDAGATWTLPEGATIQQVLMEALRPVDPLVSLAPMTLDIHDAVIHPHDGRIYIAIDDSLLMLDASANPSIIDRIEGIDLVDLHIRLAPTTAQADELQAIDAEGGFHAWEISDGADLSTMGWDWPEDLPGARAFDQAGDWGQAPSSHFAARDGALHGMHQQTTWQELISTGTNGQWPDEPVTALIAHDDMILVATDGGGIARFNQHTLLRETTWSTANVLPSDHIVDMAFTGGHLFVATAEDGVARMDWSTGTWLAVWNEGNWLLSSDMVDLEVNGDIVHMLSDAGLDVYDAGTGGFTSASTMSEMGLVGEGMDLMVWPTGGPRAPAEDVILVSDGSGRLSVLDADGTAQAVGDLLLATSPTNDEVHDVLELGGILYAAGDVGIDRFDIRGRTWLSPLLPDNGVRAMTTDGSRLFSIGDALPVDVWAANGSHSEVSLGMASAPTDLAWDALTGSLLITLGEEGLARVRMSDGDIDIWNEDDGFQRGHAFEVVARDGIAYIAVEDEGVARVDLLNDELLGSWRSSGVDEVEHAPIAIHDDRVYLGLYDAGVFIFDRDTGELVETWAQDEEQWWWWFDDGDLGANGAFTQLPNPWVIALHVDEDGQVYIGHESGFVRRTETGFESVNGEDGWFFGSRTVAFASTSTTLYAMQEWQGICSYRRSDLRMEECWNERSNSDLNIDVSGGHSLHIPAPGRLFASTDHGAYLIDTVNETILQEWSTGGSTWNTPVVVHDDIAILAVDGVGLARYDLDTSTWLETWNEASGHLPDNGVTALSDDISANHLWVAGDFGLLEIDLDDGGELNHWDTTSHPTVTRWAAQQLVRIGDVLHLLETPPERRDAGIIDIIDGVGSGGGNVGAPEPAPDGGRQGRPNGAMPGTRIYRYDVASETQLSNLNPVNRFNDELSIIGMENVRGDELWIGVGKPYAWHWSTEPGGIARWDAAEGRWLEDIEPESTTVNAGIAALIGDCDASSLTSDPEDCRILSSFGDSHHRLLAIDGTVVAEPDLDVEVRAAVNFGGHGMLATADGLLRIDHSDFSMADPWTAGDGLPPAASDNVRALDVLGGELWVVTQSSSNSASKIHRLDAAGTWMTWTASSIDEIPDGTGVSLELCGDIVHLGLTGESWNGEGGIARYDRTNDEWLEPHESWMRGDWGPEPGEEGLMWSSVNSLACDDEEVLYVGFDEAGYGIQRFDVGEDEWMATLQPWDHGFGDGANADDAMRWVDGTLAIGHTDAQNFGWSEGAFSTLAVEGDWVGTAHTADRGITAGSVSAWPQTPDGAADWLVAQPGASGPGRTQLFDSRAEGRGILDAWTGMTDGRARHFAGNDTHVYGAFLSSDEDRTDGAATILEGLIDADGDVTWERAWDMPHASIERLLLLDGTLHLTTRYNGLWTIDLAEGELRGMPPTAHDSLSIMTVHEGEIVVGFSAVEMAAGLGVFDPSTERWEDSALLPGLPSPIVRDMVQAEGHIWFGTLAGLATWDLAAEDWGPSLTAGDGLGSGDIQSLAMNGGELWVGTTGGLCAVRVTTVDTTGPSVRQCLSRSNGLVGSSTEDLVSAGGMLYASHGGFGPTRPGATQVRGVDRAALVQYHADSLPSNTVTAIAADGWGVHIATDEEPLSHWNALTNQMEHGAVASDTGGWPLTGLSSDGTMLYAASTDVLHRISVSTIGHPVVNSTQAEGIVATSPGSLGTWAAGGENGVWPFGPAPGFEILPQVIDRRATPLRVSVGGFTTDITTEARPGNAITITPGATVGPDTDGLVLMQQPVVFSSDVDGAAVWARTDEVLYNGSWDLLEDEARMRALLQAVAFGPANQTGHDLHLQFRGIEAGAVEIRIRYEAWVSDSPVQMLLFEDRPNDGGDALVATWTPTLEAGFTAYELFYDDGTTVNSVLIPDRFNVQTVLTNLTDQSSYTAWVEVVYSNGENSNSSDPLGPVTPFDDIPLAPAWGTAEMEDDALLVEWEACSAIDHFTSWANAYTSSPEPLTEFMPQGVGQGAAPDNQTSFATDGSPLWVMVYCVDDSLQADLPNPLIIGPFATGDANDTEAPSPVEWVEAHDHPDDLGGALDISWAASEAADCALYSVHVMPVDGAWPPASAVGVEIVEWITDCESTSTTVEGLANGQGHWVTVIVHDRSLNADFENSPWDTGTPLADLSTDAPPARVLMVTATDVPEDAGHAIEVTWSPVLESDLAHYTVWVSEHDVSDVSGMWSRCSFYLDTCAEMVRVAEVAGSPAPSITLSAALYGGALEESVRTLIQPDQRLFVAVTAHDGAGNVHLDGLLMAEVLPVDDLRDEEAPTRMDRPELSDVANDLGRALWMEFNPSAAEDLAWYAVYVEPVVFEQACDLQPAMLLPTDVEQPVRLERYSSGRFLEPGELATVAIVAVDAASNANCADVLTTSMAPVADALPPPTGPPYAGLTASWVENGTALQLVWQRTDAAMGGLTLHLSDSRFAEAGEAEILATTITEERYLITEIDSTKHWWIALTNDHEPGEIIQVEPLEVAPYGVDSTSEEPAFQNLDVILGAAFGVLILIAVSAFFVMRKGRRQDGLLMDHAGLVTDDMDATNAMWRSDDAPVTASEPLPEMDPPAAVADELPSMATPVTEELPSMAAPASEDPFNLDDLL